MFAPKTERIRKLAVDDSELIAQIERIFSTSTRMYIDYANVRPWSEKLGWHIDIRRLKQFLDSFSALAAVNIYNGYMMDDIQSEQEIKEIEQMHYIVRTKPVKVMQFSIDVSSIPPDSTVLVEQFIRRALLRRYEVGTIEYLNERFRDMNKKGMYTIEDRKCNFDVEIGVDMLLDLERTKTTTFVLWSGDSDFADPLLKLLRAGKKVFLFATARRISRELNALRHDGLIIFDIQKIRGFICWKREMQSKGDPGKGAPKL